MSPHEVHRQVEVGVGPRRAFELFTDRIGAWWPLDTHSVFDDGTVAFEGGVLVERRGDESAVWGEVLEWDAAAQAYGDGWPSVLTRYRELVDEVGA